MLSILEDTKVWVVNEGLWRMVEHLIILYLVIRTIRSTFLERRGKKGVKDLIIKLGIRLGQKIGPIQRKMTYCLER